MSPRIERAQTRPSRYDSSFSASLSLSPLSLSLSPSPSSFLPQPCWPASLLFFFFPGFVDLSFHGSTFANLGSPLRPSSPPSPDDFSRRVVRFLDWPDGEREYTHANRAYSTNCSVKNGQDDRGSTREREREFSRDCNFPTLDGTGNSPDM